MSIVPERRAETDRAFRRLVAARSKREADRHLIRLWELCEPEIWRALKDRAASESPGKPSAEVWLKRRGLTFDEVRNAVFPAVKDAADGYDPGHESGASFPTYAMKFIKGEVARIARTTPPPDQFVELAEAPERRLADDLRLEDPGEVAGIVAWVRRHKKSTIIETIYQRTKNPDKLSSGLLRQFADLLDAEFAEELKHDAKLQTLRLSLGVMATRAEDYEGRMVKINRLVSILAEREARKARGMHPETYSPTVLAREFGKPSQKTLKEWLRKCNAQGITASNWTPEEVAEIVWSRRGPRFRDAKQLPFSFLEA